jgi:hypothetical protein
MALSDNLEAFYQLDDTSDATGNGNTLTNTGSVAFTAGYSGNAADFANNNSRKLSTPTNFNITNTSAFSFRVLFKMPSESGSDDEIFWIAENTSPAFYLRGLYEFNGGSRRLRFFKAGSTTTFLDKSSNYGDNAWHQIVFTYNNGSMNLYVDGTTAVTGSNTSSTTTQTWNETLQVGINTNGGSNGFNGLMDEMGFWSRELTSAEVTELWGAGTPLDYAGIIGGAKRGAIAAFF